ncbi:Holliday junction branch migration protein RuvA [Clostridium grantii]|uniref:Holliday junction branch migration complex subunit RuvA n=1 Tax=Clostridium grantii DSM 8605 TaxID=1121316 RepID=A0A1M5SJY2_9CLOT|nr:Holliday junction branch migration protein RuvA [Clostridium grantii]SHH38902.1 Holliday junction DNA helicase subunit RuvA [Clostridium grantii DSM 8605]
MYEYIIGKYVGLKKEFAIIENNSLAYKIFISGNTMAQLPHINEEVKLYLQQIVREDFIGLYGFINDEEKDMFNMLLQINGVGAKAALSLLSISNVQNLKLSIITSDYKTLTKAPGIGAKTAQRIVLELKDKIDFVDDENNVNLEMNIGNNGINKKKSSEALEALVSLGFTAKEAEKALAEVDLNLNLDEIIKISLKSLIQM